MRRVKTKEQIQYKNLKFPVLSSRIIDSWNRKAVTTTKQ